MTARKIITLARDSLAVILWSAFWVLVILGAVALYAEWHVIARILP